MTNRFQAAPTKFSRSPLPRPAQDHLGQLLRAAYRESATPPAYLGDPALPSAFDDQLHRLAVRERARLGGLRAVRAALQDLLFAAQLSKH